LSQEVSALLVLHNLKLTPAQIKTLRPIAKETAAKAKAQGEIKASDDFHKALADLHKALVHAEDDERIDELLEALDDLREAERPELDDEVEITEEAVEQVPKVLRMLTAKQVAAFIAAHAGDVVDPTERLLEALDQVRGVPEEKSKEFRDELAIDVSGLVAGLDGDEAAKISDQVAQWLVIIRSLTDEEFKAQHADLEKKARAIVGEVGPTDVLRHFFEHSLADFLSNPRLPAALEAGKR
jgi:hypothetical protein